MNVTTSYFDRGRKTRITRRVGSIPGRYLRHFNEFVCTEFSRNHGFWRFQIAETIFTLIENHVMKAERRILVGERVPREQKLT